jgi:hypothetical protein
MMDGVVETCEVHAAELDSFPYAQTFHFLDGLKVIKVRPILLHSHLLPYGYIGARCNFGRVGV